MCVYIYMSIQDDPKSLPILLPVSGIKLEIFLFFHKGHHNGQSLQFLQKQ